MKISYLKNMLTRMAAVAALLVSTLSVTQAALVVDVSGVPGSNQTTWTFSGSYTMEGGLSEFDGELSFNGSGNFSSGDNFFNHGGGDLSGELLPNSDLGNNFSIGILSGNATVTGSSSGVHLIDGLVLDDDQSAGTQNDDFAWLAAGTFVDGETVSFAGSVVVALGITTFGDGVNGLPFTLTSNVSPTPLTMNFSEAVVPEPTSTALLLGATGLLALRRRR